MAEQRNTGTASRRRSVQAAHARQEARRTGARSQRSGSRPRRVSRRRQRNRLLAAIGLVAALLVVAVIALVILTRLGGRQSSQAEDATYVVQEGYATSPYDWSCLQTDEHGRLCYVMDGEVLSRTGIDVSEHQGQIDWHAVAFDGIDFCYLRAGWRGSSEGSITADSMFATNLAGAQAAGLDVGVYFFSQAITPDEAVEEAEFVLSCLDGTELAYPVAFDLEPTGTGQGRADSLTREEQTAVALAFCERIEAGGYRTVVYGNQYDYERYEIARLMSRGYWYAEYAAIPSTNLDIAFWQYSNAGQVAGIDTEVDLDIDLTPALAALR